MVLAGSVTDLRGKTPSLTEVILGTESIVADLAKRAGAGPALMRVCHSERGEESTVVVVRTSA
jgi:hypothetical protein